MKSNITAVLSALLLTALTLAPTTTVHASVLFDNLSQQTDGSRISGVAAGSLFGQQFLTDNHSYTLNSVNALLARPGVDNPAADAFGYFYLMDSTFTPQGMLVSLPPLSTSLTPISLISMNDPIQLLPNSTYWLLAFAATDRNVANLVDSVTWGYTDSSSGSGPGLSANWLVAAPDPTFYTSSPFIMQVNVTETTAVPEPSTYALLCLSLGVVGYARKRMVSKECEG